MTIYNLLISAEDLYTHYREPGWVIVDCRFNLKQPEWGLRSYRHGHIPGAVYADLDRDLAAPVIPGKTGRHPLPEMQKFADLLGTWGIGNDSQVVAYDTVSGAFAARLWWMLRFLGHTAAAVLDGGYQKWTQKGYPVSQGEEYPSPRSFQNHPRPEMTADAHEVDQIRQRTDYQVIDARAPERYRGEVEPIDPVAGHIPGAVNRFHGDNLRPDGTFASPDRLREDFLALLGDIPSDHSIVYCGSGVTSCHHLIAMEVAGLKPGRLYPGSWSEWITDPNRPVEKSA